MAKARRTTKDRLIDAAISTLRSHGYAGASARQIATVGKLNQALVFYHFGSVEDLWLAALDRTSAKRLARYEERLAEAKTLREMVEVARELYREDIASGHVKVLAELVSAGSSSPGLGPRVAARVDPWVALIETTITRAVAGTPVVSIMPPKQIAEGIAAFYLGAEMLSNLGGDDAHMEAMFDSAQRVATLLSAFPAQGAKP
jgi:AcrR family transcriptional regulator